MGGGDGYGPSRVPNMPLPEPIQASAFCRGRNGGIHRSGHQGAVESSKPLAAVASRPANGICRLKKINETLAARAAELLADPGKAETLLK